MAGQNILEALDEALRTGEGIGEVVGAFFGLAKSADTDTRTRMLASLDERLRAHPLERVASVALLAGALVEVGTDLRSFPPAVFDQLLAQLETIKGPDDETELPDAFYEFERAAMACLSSSAGPFRRNLPP